MSTATIETFRQLIANAVIDEAFRDLLIASPKEAAKQFGDSQKDISDRNHSRFLLDDDDVEELSKVTDDLLRFGRNSNLDPVDADIWAVGIVTFRQVKLWALNWLTAKRV